MYDQFRRHFKAGHRKSCKMKVWLLLDCLKSHRFRFHKNIFTFLTHDECNTEFPGIVKSCPLNIPKSWRFRYHQIFPCKKPSVSSKSSKSRRLLNPRSDRQGKAKKSSLTSGILGGKAYSYKKVKNVFFQGWHLYFSASN